MKNLDNYKITKRFMSAGHYHVYVYEGINRIGDFETTDMQLIGDISEMDNGFEEDLCMHDTFEEVIETCIERAM